MRSTDNPIEAANHFAKTASAEGFSFDFSLQSLESEIDKFLDKHRFTNETSKSEIECKLTAYIGETIRRLYEGEWTGDYFGQSSSYRGPNFYTCKVSIGKFEFFPNHFIAYYLENGKESEGTFYDYLHSRDNSHGLFHDFLGGGLLNIIARENSTTI
ncbi:hypothetical protein [Chryseolinea lacunae]|uniref:Uncharacterized protein n=1 Tax=Chryseolinea lacunae TaxID=2801331 RepID=A0ABS1KMZ6_9BACT|nr:hypothetical protein [Chryseolinea lacunae]MBL0740719.1 hypothetical protein [Chryseolinea lacunae]